MYQMALGAVTYHELDLRRHSMDARCALVSHDGCRLLNTYLENMTGPSWNAGFSWIVAESTSLPMIHSRPSFAYRVGFHARCVDFDTYARSNIGQAHNLADFRAALPGHTGSVGSFAVSLLALRLGS